MVLAMRVEPLRVCPRRDNGANYFTNDRTLCHKVDRITKSRMDGLDIVILHKDGKVIAWMPQLNLDAKFLVFGVPVNASKSVGA